jgi:glycerol-3-phosphate dehydrogenase subunit B
VNRDVVVIGGGMAGIAAALAGAGRGARVTLIQRAPGATALCVGGWLGPLPASLATQFEQAGHPWLVLSQPLPSPDGSLRRFDRAAEPQAAAQFTGSTLVCGIVGLPGFQARVLARMWSEWTGTDVLAETVQLERTPAAGWSPPSLAGEIARDPDSLGRALAARVRQTGAGSVIVPPVLGLDGSDTTRRTIESMAGVAVGEALGFAPSIPGWRLDGALARMVERAGIDRLRGTVEQARTSNGRVDGVVVQTSGKPIELVAASFVLATGKFVGGGIRAEGRLRESALQCPIWVEHAGEVFEQAEPLTLTNADRREEQPLLAAGVAVDAEGRPIDRNGTLVYHNVWTAGAVRRGYDSPSVGLGHAAAEGWAAGERATG